MGQASGVSERQRRPHPLPPLLVKQERGTAKTAMGGQGILIEAPVIDGVVINMPDCPYQGAQQAAWQCGYIAGSKNEDCEPGPVFEADDNLRSAWVQGYVLAYHGRPLRQGIYTVMDDVSVYPPSAELYEKLLSVSSVNGEGNGAAGNGVPALQDGGLTPCPLSSEKLEFDKSNICFSSGEGNGTQAGTPAPRERLDGDDEQEGGKL